jgi:hypothetical protein
MLQWILVKHSRVQVLCSRAAVSGFAKYGGRGGLDVEQIGWVDRFEISIEVNQHGTS